MTLVDTSVWIDHIDHGIDDMSYLLNADGLVMHPLIVGELAMGNLRMRQRILTDLMDIDRIRTVTHEEVLHFVEHFRLYGMGIGYVDAHLLASTRMTPGCQFWTRDKRLKKAATDLGVASPLV